MQLKNNEGATERQKRNAIANKRSNEQIKNLSNEVDYVSVHMLSALNAYMPMSVRPSVIMLNCLFICTIALVFSILFVYAMLKCRTKLKNIFNKRVFLVCFFFSFLLLCPSLVCRTHLG